MTSGHHSLRTLTSGHHSLTSQPDNPGGDRAHHLVLQVGAVHVDDERDLAGAGHEPTLDLVLVGRGASRLLRGGSERVTVVLGENPGLEDLDKLLKTTGNGRKSLLCQHEIL